VSAAAQDDSGVGPDQPGLDQPLSALEDALRRALASCSREQVLDRVVTVLPSARAAGRDAAPRPGLHGAVQKVSVSLPGELTEAIRARTGTGGFSRYVADAVQERIRLDLLRDLLDELQAEYGPVDAEGVREAMAEWPDYETE
jgi:Arc/MetJ-type ribon-helix-helix transcriptional regulator